MQYVFLIHDTEKSPVPGGPGWDDYMAGFFAFGAELKQRGIEFSGAPLAPTSTASTVRVREGKPLVTDGPFAETKEWFSGFYKLECKNLDEALELAAMIPSARYGCVEVRPLNADVLAHSARHAAAR